VSENLEVVRRLTEASERRDIPAALACLDPDVEWIPLRAATEGIYRGHAGFERFMTDTDETFESFEPDVELEALGDRVLAWGTIRVQGKGSGLEVEVSIGGIFDLREGKVSRWRDYGSREKALEAASPR